MQRLRDLVSNLLVRVTPSFEVGQNLRLKHFDHVFDQRVELVGRTAFGQALGFHQRGWGLKDLHLQRLIAFAARRYAELDLLTRFQLGDTGWEGGLMHEDVFSLVTGEESESL